MTASAPFAAAALLVALASTAAALQTGIHCASGTVAHSCPNTAPVCCFMSTGESAGCCMINTLCDPRTGGCKPGPRPPHNETPVVLHDTTESVHMTVGHLVLVIAIMVGILVAAFVLVFAWFGVRRHASERAEERRRMLQEQSDDDADGDSVTSDDEALLRREAGAAAATAVDVNGDAPPAPVSPGRADDATAEMARCCICKTREVDSLLLPCAHTVLCHACAKRMKRCPDCDKVIKRRKKIFMA
jgi:hypothetical protein